MDGPAFDELTKALRSASTRRQAAGGLLGFGLAALTGRGLTEAKGKRHAKHKRDGTGPSGKGNGKRDGSGPGGKDGNSACAHFCAQVFPPGPDRGRCVSDGAHGTGLCALAACQRQGKPDASKVCCVKQNGVCPDYATATCCTGNDTCGGGNPGTPGVCGCTPSTTCPNGRTCGTANDNCGGTITCTGCAGCCDGNDCNGGASDIACGKTGAACADCTTSSQVCYQQACCTPQCAGKACGDDDGCGGTCDGPCSDECQTCDGGVCNPKDDGTPCGGANSGLRCCKGKCPPSVTCTVGCCDASADCQANCCADCCSGIHSQVPYLGVCPGTDGNTCFSIGPGEACATDFACGQKFADVICRCGVCCSLPGSICGSNDNCCSNVCGADGTCQ